MSASEHTPSFAFALGCPVWSSEAWSDVVYPAGTPRRQWLSWYSRMFNTVEGNSTFYALPSVDIAKRWADETAEGFRFALKFPREISHEGPLRASAVLDRFIEIVTILNSADRAGPSFLQLPPWFDCFRFQELVEFLQRLPGELAWAVEPRHGSWFEDDRAEHEFNQALVSLRIDRVIFDSRALFQSPPEDQSEAVAQARKPNPAVHFIRTGARPVVRLIGRNRVELADAFAAQWLPVLQQWTQDGCQPYVFTHAPDDRFAPAFARRFAAAYAAQYRVSQELPTPATAEKQMRLFD